MELNLKISPIRRLGSWFQSSFQCRCQNFGSDYFGHSNSNRISRDALMLALGPGNSKFTVRYFKALLVLYPKHAEKVAQKSS